MRRALRFDATTLVPVSRMGSPTLLAVTLPAVLQITRAVWHQMVGHAYDGLPDEACGLLAVRRAPAGPPPSTLSERRRVQPGVHDRPEGPPPRRPRCRGPGARGQRRDAQPHPHRRLPLAHRRRAGAGTVLALRHRSLRQDAPAPEATGSSTASSARRSSPSTARADRVESRRASRLSPSWPSRISARPHRRHADRRHLAAQPDPPRADPGQARGPEPGRLRQGPSRQADILDGEKDGILAPGSGQVILESSSGNTGVALAMITKVRGYVLKVVLPDNVSTERRSPSSRGARRSSTVPGRGLQRRHRRAQTMAEEHPEWWFPFQYGNPANPKAHYEGTGPRSGARTEITHFIAGLGTRAPSWASAVPQGADPNVSSGHRAAGRRDVDPQELRRGLRAARLSRQRRLRPARPPAHRAPAGVDQWTRRLTEVGVFTSISSGASSRGR